ncbi:MAG TPA: cupin domain-containing protein [Stellaceae bacterium]|nr:cupin domain-containing protein [Stellaceae bacterium]
MPDDVTATRGFKRAEIAKDAAFFKLRAPLPDQGRMDTEVARTETFSARVKVYASGGENTLHCHTSEDHLFVVLQGKVRFYDKDGGTVDLGKNEGVMRPAKTYYWFEATSTEPLVMLRVGARAGKPAGDDRLNIRGEPMAGDSEENKSVPVIVRENAFFE